MSDVIPKKEELKETLHLIDNWLDFQVYIKEIPGIAVGVYVKDEIIFKKEYGYADLETKTKLTDQHMFRIASHSKLFTATAIMKLYHEEKLSIDDKVSKHLPWFTSEKDENLQHVRIHHLLTHSSGVSRDGETAHWYNYNFPGKEEIMKQVKEGITFFGTSEVLKYSNFGFTLLGLIIEAVSGKTYQEYIQEEIFDPLEMTNSVVDVNESNIERHATGYHIKYPGKDREKFEQVPANVMHAATGLSSTVEDMIKYYKARMLGNDILFPDYIKREMQRSQFKYKDEERGLGFGVAKMPTKEMYGHGGGYPGFITRSGLFKDEKIIIVVLTNAVNGPASQLLIGIKAILEKYEKEKSKFEAKDGEKLPDLKDVIGFYISDWGQSLFTQMDSKLILTSPGLDNPADYFYILEHVEGLKFKNPKEMSYSSPGQVIEFVKGPDGKMIFIDSHRGENKWYEFSY
ncbi:MAG: serine hydrolase domain-containing protein [Candidatus Heimdallarchaeota archaeon]